MPNLNDIHLDGNMFPEDVTDSLKAAHGDRLLDMERNDEDEDIDGILYESCSENGNHCICSVLSLNNVQELPNCVLTGEAARGFDKTY